MVACKLISMLWMSLVHWALNSLSTSAFSPPEIRTEPVTRIFPTSRRRSIHLFSKSTKSASSQSIRKQTKKPSNTRLRQKPIQQSASFQGVDVRTQLTYAREGHAVVRGLLSPQYVTNTLRPTLLKLAKQQELQAWRQKVEVVLGSKETADSCATVAACQEKLQLHFGKDHELTLPFLQYFNNWRQDITVADLVRSETLARTAAELLGVSSVRLYQDSLFWKRVGDGPTPWHADARMAPFDTSLMITFWIPLQKLNQFDSALVFCSKSHSDFALPFWHPVKDENDSMDEEDSEWFKLEERYDISDNEYDSTTSSPLVDYLPMKVGDVTVHSGWTLHSADPAVDRDRVALAVTYVDSRAPIRADAVLASRTNEGRGDNEDAWSYQSWAHQVRPNRRNFQHKLVPIVWPQRRQTSKPMQSIAHQKKQGHRSSKRKND